MQIMKIYNFKKYFKNHETHRISNENKDTNENHRISMRESRKS